jgi:RNA polymerase sigma factor (sigma-70 family)
MESLSPELTAVLLDNHERFLSFLEKRTESREVAEEILQASIVRGLERSDTLQDNDKVVAWFYRLLRNAVIDYYRAKGTKAKALERLLQETETTVAPPEMEKLICTCIDTLIPTLKAEYTEILTSVELQGKSLREFAAEHSLQTNNATVRLHRARQALKRQIELTCGACSTHACLECTCHKPL